MNKPSNEDKLSTEGTLTPAYGRNYTTKAQAVTDFRNGFDFYYQSPFRACYCSIRDFKAGDMVKLRYNGRKDVGFYIVVEGDLK